MAIKSYHILNGDALKHQFPSCIKGEKIIMRACLVDGDVVGSTNEALYVTICKLSLSNPGYIPKQINRGT